MVSQKVKIINPTGLHLRPAGNLCKEAMKYKSKITFEYSGNTANAKCAECTGGMYQIWGRDYTCL